TDPTGIIATITASVNVNCFGGTNGTATVTVSGGTSPYTYLWSNSQTTATTTGLSAGQYTVTVTGTGGCKAIALATITQPDLLIAQIVASTNATCNGLSNGTATVNATGGITGYTYLWSNLQTTATATGLSQGTYTVTVTDTHNCTATANVSITQSSLLSASVTVNQNVTCYGGNDGIATVTVSGGAQPFIINWSNGSSGTVATGLTAGNYQITIFDANGCTASANVTITQPVGPITVNAGVDAAICSSAGSYTLAGSSSNSTSVHWTTSGTGTFSNANILNPIYTPSLADITDAQVQLTLTASGNTGCQTVNDYMVLTIWQAATGYAGKDARLCNGNSYQILDARATHYSSVLWTIDAPGTGTLANATTLTPTYTPLTGFSGTVTLTLTVTPMGGTTCPVVTDQITLTVNLAPTVVAGANSAICSSVGFYTLSGSATNYSSIHWTTSGTGTFTPTAANILNAVYIPSSADFVTGQVNLTLTAYGTGICGMVSDMMVLTLSPMATANAGPDVSTCAGSPFILTGATATNYSGITWSGGTGSFSNIHALNPTYTPGAGETGNVILTLTATGLGTCSDVSDVMTLTIINAPTANAGADVSICATTGHYILLGSAANYSSIHWTTSGTGTFTPNATTLAATYNPSASDNATGQVQITLTANGNGNCGNVSDMMVITILMGATANAGPDMTICAGTTYELIGAQATNYTSLVWTTTGTGIFLPNATSLNPFYIASAADTVTGAITLTLTSTGNGLCATASDAMILTIKKAPIANAGADASICASTGTYQLNGTALHQVSVLWTTGGTGTFTPLAANILNPVYNPSPSDFAAGQVQLTLTAIGESGCGIISDMMVITMNPLPALYVVTGSGSYCAGGPGVVVGLSGSQAGIRYTLIPGGNEVIGTGTAINFGSHTAGTYTVTALNTTTSCLSNMTGSAIVTVNPLPTAFSVTGSGSYCAGSAGVVVGLSGSQTGVSYTLNPGGLIVVGTGNAITFGIQTAGTYTVSAHNTTTLCSNTMTGSAIITMYPMPVVVTHPQAACSPNTVDLTAAAVTSGSTAGLIFTYWTDAAATIAYTTPTSATAGTYYIKGTQPVAGCFDIKPVTVTVNPIPAANAGTAGLICAGSGYTIGATTVPGSSYIWTSTPAGFTSTLSNPLVSPLVTTTYTLVETIAATGCANTHNVIVTVNPKPSLVITNPDAVCVPDKVDLTAPGITIGSSLEGVTLSYWLDVAATTPMTNYTAAGAGTYYIKASTAAGCFDIKPVTVTVNSLPWVFTVTGGGFYCPGGPGVLVTVTGSQVGVNYSLWIELTLVHTGIPGTGGQISFPPQIVAGKYSIQAENATTHCTNWMFNCVEIFIEPQLPVSVSIAASANPAPTGVAVTFTATHVNGGVAPTYQWKVNGLNVGSNLSTFTYTPVNADEVSCVLTSDITCVSGNPATSNIITMGVMGIPSTISVTGNIVNGQSICYNALQTITVAGSGTTFTVLSGGSATMIAGQKIVYMPGTTVHAGGYMHGYITNNNQYCGQPPASIPKVVTEGEDTLSVNFGQTFFTIYPNPTTGNFTLEQKSGKIYGKVNVEIYGMRGEKLITGELIGEKKREFYISDLPHGLYFVKVVAEEYVETFKLVKTR
ncbi:MAG: T9SS type A sorting domain-containing protein, partial [Bacteroidota bacterium]